MWHLLPIKHRQMLLSLSLCLESSFQDVLLSYLGCPYSRHPASAHAPHSIELWVAMLKFWLSVLLSLIVALFPASG